MLAINMYNVLNCDDNLKSLTDKHLGQNRPAVPHPLVLYKDPLGEGKWEGPVALLTWGRGYACFFSPERPLELHRRGRRHMRKGFPGSDPPPPHWTLLIQDSSSCTSPTLKYNSIQYSWSDIQHHLEGLYQFKLQLELHQQLQDIQ